MERLEGTNMGTILSGGTISGAVGAAKTLGASFPVKFLLASPAVVIHQFFPHDPTPLMILLSVMGIDWLTGVAAAIKEREWSSRGLLRGGGKLVAYFVLIIAALQVSLMAPNILSWLPEVTYAYIGLTELTSIIENIGRLGYETKLTRIIYNRLSMGKRELLGKDTITLDAKGKSHGKKRSKRSAK